MVDKFLRSSKEEVLSPLALRLLRPVHPISITLAAWGVGLAASVAAWYQAYLLALALWLLNRLLDGLDGTVARLQQKQSDLGAYLDVLLDTTIYTALPVALALQHHTAGGYLSLALLLGSFYLNTASWMYLAALLEKRHSGAGAQGDLTTITMPAGLIEGTETIIFICLALLLPTAMVPLFLAMALLVCFTVIERVVWAVRQL